MMLSFAVLPFNLNVAYADESDTNTEQGLSQENIGSGESIDTNCGQNSIGADSVTLTCSEETTPSPLKLELHNCITDMTDNTIVCDIEDQPPYIAIGCPEFSGGTCALILVELTDTGERIFSLLADCRIVEVQSRLLAFCQSLPE